jgi:putative membrane protein
MKPLSLLWRGICMGMADIIPGVSGGTMAYITGIYDQLLSSIRTINRQALLDLCLLRWGALFNQVAWRFLLPLAVGICLAFFAAAPLITYLLYSPAHRPNLLGLFLGLILVSAWLCGRQAGRWKGAHWLAALGAAIIAWWLSAPTEDLVVSSTFAQYVAQTSTWPIDPWLIGAGCAAAIAMLLPGISGSYLLTILGLYGPAMGAINSLMQGGGHHLEALKLLANLGVGILLGLAIGARAIRWLLHHYRGWTLAALTGFMVGALRSIWPFTASHSASAWQLALTLLCIIVGGALVWTLDFAAQGRTQQDVK